MTMAKQHSKNDPVDAQHIATCLDDGDDFAFEMQVLHLLADVGEKYYRPAAATGHDFPIRAVFGQSTSERRAHSNAQVTENKQLRARSSAG